MEDAELRSLLETHSLETRRYVDAEGAETRKHFDATVAEIRQEFRNSTAEIRQEFKNSRAEIQQQFNDSAAEIKQQFNASTAEMKKRFDETTAEIKQHFDTVKAELTQRMDSTSSEMRRHFEIIAEGLRGEIQLLAESLSFKSDAHDRFASDTDERISALDLRVDTPRGSAQGTLKANVYRTSAVVPRIALMTARTSEASSKKQVGFSARSTSADVFPRGHGDRGRAVRDAATHVIDRVADDDHVAAGEMASEMIAGAADGHGRKLRAVGGIAPERAEGKVPVEIRAAQFQSRTRLDVSREQRQRNAVVLVQGGHQLAHPRHDLHALRRGVAGQTGQIELPQLRQPCFDVRLRETGVAQHHVRDLRIGASGEIVAGEIARVSVDRAQRVAERFA